MGPRPRIKNVKKVRFRRCPKCQRQVRKHQKRCPGCHKSQPKLVVSR